MNAEIDPINSALRKNINKKFHQLHKKFGLGFEWAATAESEEGELTLFLLTGPTMNEVQEYLQNKINDWTIALDSLVLGDSRKAPAQKQITVYELLIGYTDQLIEKEK